MHDSPPTSQATTAFRAARDQLLALRGDHERALAEFAWPDPGTTVNWAHDWFDVVAREHPDDDALVVLAEDGSRSVRSWGQLRLRSDRLAGWLAGRGVRRGDAVLVMLGNRPELWESVLAVMKLGAVVVPTTTAVGPAGLRERLVRSGAVHVVCAGEDAGVVDAADAADGRGGSLGGLGRTSVGPAASDRPGWADLAEAERGDAAAPPHPGTAPGDPLLLYFTSGTTAQPKLVQHSQVSYPLGHLSTMYWQGLRPGDRHLNISSPGWAKHAWSSIFAPFAAEATVVVTDYRRFDPAVLREQLVAEGVTTLCAPPTVWRMMIGADLGERPPALRELVSAGEPLNPEVIARVQRAWGLPVRDGFGQTETTASIGNPPGARLKPGSMGRPLPGVPVVVVDPATGEPAREGEICLDLSGERGAPLTLMTGYRGDGAGASTGGDDSRAGRWYRSGDLATVDEDGWITYVGREDDVFKASDYKISPFEVESVLIEHPAVAEAGVVPAPDALRLAVPKAYVALAAGHEPTRETALAILAHARAHLAPWQRVRRLAFVELPKTLSGKIRRVELREGDPSGGREWRDEEFDELRS